MPTNYPGPYGVSLKYTTGSLTHEMFFSVKTDTPPSPGDDPTTIQLLRRDGTTIDLDQYVSLFANLVADRLDPTDSIDAYDFWEIEPQSTVRNYITSGTLNIPGTSSLSRRDASQETYTFRTTAGGILKIVILETTTQNNAVIPYAQVGGSSQALMDFVVAANTAFVARDDGWPFSPLNLASGENEAVWRKRYR